MKSYPPEYSTAVWIVHTSGPMDVDAVFDSEWAAERYAEVVNERDGHTDGGSNARIVMEWPVYSDPERAR